MRRAGLGSLVQIIFQPPIGVIAERLGVFEHQIQARVITHRRFGHAFRRQRDAQASPRHLQHAPAFDFVAQAAQVEHVGIGDPDITPSIVAHPPAQRAAFIALRADAPRLDEAKLRGIALVIPDDFGVGVAM